MALAVIGLLELHSFVRIDLGEMRSLRFKEKLMLVFGIVALWALAYVSRFLGDGIEL